MARGEADELTGCRARLSTLRALGNAAGSELTVEWVAAKAEFAKCQDRILFQANQDSEFKERWPAITSFSADDEFQRLRRRLRSPTSSSS